MYRAVAKAAPKICPGADVLSISGSEGLLDVLGVERPNLTVAQYPEVSMLSLPYDDKTFDLVLSDQVLEHVEGDPFEAFSECTRVLKTGGVFVHTTCMMNPIHPYPGDFWRFTEDALRLLASRSGDVLEAGSWGNFAALQFIHLGLRFLPVPLLKWHPIHKIATSADPEWPIVTWVIGRNNGRRERA